MKNGLDWIACIGIYFLLLAAHGYIFGANDQMDFIPYALHLQQPNLYTNDFYIQCIKGHLNERYFLSHLISLLPCSKWSNLFFFLHFLFSLLLIAGLIKFSNLFLRERWISYFVTCATLLIAYNINLGGNELYYNMLCGSLLAKSLGIWAIYLAYQKKLWLAVILSVFATYAQPIAGAQIIFIAGLLLLDGSKVRFYFLALLGVCPYVYALTKDLGTSIATNSFLEIMELRNAHHFIPWVYPIKNYLVLTPIFLIGTLSWKHINKNIYVICLFILLGCIIYSILLPFLPKLTIMSQWFKTTIWLKFFSLLAIIIFLSKRVRFEYLKPYLAFIVFLFTFYKYYKQQIYTSPYPPFSENKNILFAKGVRDQSNVNDVFLVSPEFTEFKYFSERSCYVDWKAIPHNGECLIEWYRRIKLGYGLENRSGNDLTDIYYNANQYLKNLDAESKVKLKSEGVTKIIFKENKTDWKIIAL